MALKIMFTILLFLTTLVFSFSQNSRTTERGALLGWSARTAGLGRTNLASYTQPLDVLNNPALLSGFQDDYAISYTHNEGLGGISKLDNLLLLISRDSAKYHFGVNVYRFSNSDVFETTNIFSGGEVDFDNLGTLKNNDVGFKLLLARSLREDKSNIGIELNFDLLSVSDFSKSAVLGFDLGYSTVLSEKINYGLSIDNIFGKYYFWSQDSEILESSYFASGNFIRHKSTFVQLPYIQNSINYLFYKQDKVSVSGFGRLSLGFGRTNNFSISSNWLNSSGGLGLEIVLFDRFNVRGGVTDVENIWKGDFKLSPALGAGYGYKGLNLDYSWGDFYGKSIPLQKHVVSISIKLQSEKNTKSNDTNEPTRL